MSVPQEVKASRHDTLLADDGTCSCGHGGGGGSGSAGLIWRPVMVNDPSIVTTTGLPVFVPWVTVDGEAIMVEA